MGTDNTSEDRGIVGDWIRAARNVGAAAVLIPLGLTGGATQVVAVLGGVWGGDKLADLAGGGDFAQAGAILVGAAIGGVLAYPISKRIIDLGYDCANAIAPPHP